MAVRPSPAAGWLVRAPLTNTALKQLQFDALVVDLPRGKSPAARRRCPEVTPNRLDHSN